MASLAAVASGLASQAVSLARVFLHGFRRRATILYPEVKPYIPPRFRGRIVLTRDPDGEERCVACNLCAVVCPTRCIELTGHGKGKERRAATFFIDHNLCMYCNLCVEVCPFDAITMWTRIDELSAYTRSGLVYDQPTMTADRFYPTPMTPEPSSGAGKAGAGGK